MTITDQLQSKLPRGAKTKLAANHKVTKSMVTYVFKNNLTDHPIFHDAIKMAEEYQEKKKSLSEKVKAI